MPVGIHSQVVGQDGDRPRLRELGFRVTVGPDEVDLTDLVSGLRYASRLPGGFADCTFNLHMPLVDAAPYLIHLAPVHVYFEGSLAWEGRIEEPPRGSVGTEALPVTALGRGAKLKRQKFTKLFVTAGYGGWRNSAELVAGSERVPNNTQFVSPGFPSDANANPGVLVGYPNTQAMDANDRHAWIWSAPPACEILRVKGSWNAVGASANILGSLFAMTALAGYAGTSAETIVAARTITAGDTTFDDTLAASGCTYLRLDFAQTVSGTAAADLFYHVHSMQIVGARTAEGEVFDPSQVTTYAVIRSLLAAYGGSAVQASDEAMQLVSLLPSFLPGYTNAPSFAWPDLVFDQPTTVEDAITKLNEPVGWEWGVFEDGLFYYGPIQLITTLGRESAAANVLLKNYPPWWLSALAQDGHRVTLSQSLSDIVNEVFVYYTDASGARQYAYASDFGNAQNPLNERDGSGPRDVVTGTVDLPGTSDAASAAQVASAYLAQYSRPQVKGDVVWNGLTAFKVQIGTGSLTQISDGSRVVEAMSTPLIRPGHWIEVGDAVGLVDVSWQTVRQPTGTSTQDRAAPNQLLPIRSVEVNADAGQVTCSVDSSRDEFSTTIARLQLAAAA